MHPWRPWFVLAGLAAFAGHAAVVYKWTDADGVVHYSDQSVPGAQKIYTAGGSIGSVSPDASASDPSTGAKKQAPGLGYAAFSITSPTAEQSFFGDDAVGVNLSLEPTLQPNQSLTWHLNGRELDDQAGATHFVLPHLERGAYVIAATITDQASGESRTSDSVTFYVRQPSALSPQHRNP